MPEKIDLSYAIGLPPEKAIEYFKSKGYKLTWDWYDIWQEAHAKAFTVAKVMRMDILQDIRDMVQKALNEGITQEQFRKELEPKLKAKGWWGYKFVSYPDGRVEKILEGSPWRLKTIYRTNMQTAYMAGRYKEQMENVDARPYWQYVAVMDNRTRPAHAALNGKIFPADDPFWDTHYPPLGYNCRCRVRALSQKDIDRKGLPVDSAEGRIRWEDTLVSKKTGEIQPVAVYHDPVTGMKIPTDVGWSYNPGKSAWFPDLDKYPYDVAKQWIKGGLTGPDFKAFYEGKIKGNFPVAVLSPEEKEVLGSKSQVVLLSSDTLKKQLSSHPDLTIEDYQKIPDIIANGEVYQQKEERLIYFFKEGILYRASLKRTIDRLENYFLSLFKTNEKDFDRQIRKKMKRLR
jgi:SPP1 gp7 family putative phage head morphogenesis protein